MLPGFTADSAMQPGSGVYVGTPAGVGWPAARLHPQLTLRRGGGVSAGSISCCCGSGAARMCTSPMSCPHPQCTYSCKCGDGYVLAHCACRGPIVSQ
jgi:hypothetical protein